MPALRCDGLSSRKVTVQAAPGVKIDPTARFGAGVSLGENVRIGPGCAVAAGCRLDSHVTLRARSSIGAKTRLNHVTVGAESVIGAESILVDCEIEPHVTLGNKAECHYVTLRQEVTVGENFKGFGHPSKRIYIIMTRIGDNVSMHGDISIAAGTTIDSMARIQGDNARTAIGRLVTIGRGCVIRNSSLDIHAQLSGYVTINNSSIGEDVQIDTRTKVESAQLGIRVVVGKQVIIRPGVVIPDQWLIPDDAIVNPASPVPVIIPRTA